MDGLTIRLIQEEDNALIARIIRTALVDFNADKPGTAYFSPTTDEVFQTSKRLGLPYFIAELNGEVIGGAGLSRTSEMPQDIVELVKMYLKKEVRGQGIASELIDTCIEAAKNLGYKKMYLESLPELTTALKVYEKKGWKFLEKRIGNSCFVGCNVWMIRDLD
jgi:putative acetyltransferase